MQHNKFTRALAGVAAAAISLGLFAVGAGTAQAADKPGITISGAVAGHEFKAYRLASYGDITSGGTQDGIVYGKDGVIESTALRTIESLNAAIKTAAETAAKAQGGAGNPKSETLPTQYKLAAGGVEGAKVTDNPAGWVASWDATTDAKALKQFAADLAKSEAIASATPDATATAGADATTVTLSSYNTGYYLVTDSQGLPILVGSTVYGYTKLGNEELGKATVKEQTTVTAPTKTVDRKSLSVGGNASDGYATFTIEAKLPSTSVEDGYVYNIVDTPAKGLSVTKQGMVVTVGDKELNSRQYAVDPGIGLEGDGAKTFTITIRNVNKYAAGAAVKVQYRGYITTEPAYNEQGVAELTSQAYIAYGAKGAALQQTAASAPAVLKVFKGLQFTKISAKDNSALAGAEFLIKAKASEGNNAYVANARAKSVSAADGVVSFSGLGAGVYTVTETKAPEGYYANVRPSFDVTIYENGKVTFGRDTVWDLVDNTNQTNVTVKNVNQATQLPSTGGAGLAFIMAAIVLAAGGSVFFAAKYTRNRRITRA